MLHTWKRSYLPSLTVKQAGLNSANKDELLCTFWPNIPGRIIVASMLNLLPDCSNRMNGQVQQNCIYSLIYWGVRETSDGFWQRTQISFQPPVIATAKLALSYTGETFTLQTFRFLDSSLRSFSLLIHTHAGVGCNLLAHLKWFTMF